MKHSTKKLVLGEDKLVAVWDDTVWPWGDIVVLPMRRVVLEGACRHGRQDHGCKGNATPKHEGGHWYKYEAAKRRDMRH